MGLGRRTFAGVTLTLVGAVAVAFDDVVPAAGERRDAARAFSAQAANETLEFVNVEIDRSGMAFPDQWVITDNSASLDTAQYSHQHSWTIPQDDPAGGAQATVTTDRDRQERRQDLRQDDAVRLRQLRRTGTAVEAVANADKNAGRGTVTETKTVTLTPRGGGPVFITARVQDGPDVKFNYRVVTPPPPPPPAPPPASPPPAALPAVTPRSTLPRIGVLTSYAAPRPLGTLVLGFPKFPANAASATVDVALTDPSGRNVDDPGFIAAVEPSGANVEAAATALPDLHLAERDSDREAKQVDSGSTLPSSRAARQRRLAHIAARRGAAEAQDRREAPAAPRRRDAASRSRCARAAAAPDRHWRSRARDGRRAAHQAALELPGSLAARRRGCGAETRRRAQPPYRRRLRRARERALADEHAALSARGRSRGSDRRFCSDRGLAMQPAFSYRRATTRDAPAMCETAVLGFAGYAAFAPAGWRPPREPGDVAKLTGRMALERAVAWLAEHDGRPAGHVLLIPASESREPVDDPRAAHVMHVFVREPYWGTGVARELLRRLLDGARSEGFERARLFTPAGQARARRFYEREGWELARGWEDIALGLPVVEYRKDPI